MSEIWQHKIDCDNPAPGIARNGGSESASHESSDSIQVRKRCSFIADTSKKAYAGVVYIRTLYYDWSGLPWQQHPGLAGQISSVNSY